MWNGKKKALTFSFDDGVLQDVRAIEILRKYNLGATFNINAGFFGTFNELDRNDRHIRHDKVRISDAPAVYRGFEVAGHTLTHPLLPELDDATVTYQVNQDAKILESVFGYPIVGMAYPGGPVNNDDRVADVIRRTTAMQYARTTTCNGSFERQTNLLRFRPTVYYIHEDEMFTLGEKFLKLNPDEPSVFYVWGHTYEMDAEYISWQRFEEFCKMMSGKDDIYYCTNKEALLSK